MFRLGGLVVCLLIGTALALYPSSSDVVTLTASNFDRLVGESNAIWIVEFFAPWCGHCKALVPEYSKAAAALKGVAKVGAINCDEEKSLAGRFGIQGFPTIKVFGADKKKPKDYSGPRTAQGLADEAISVIRSKVNAGLSGKKSKDGGSDSRSNKDVVELNDDNFKSLVYDSTDYWLVEFYMNGCGYCERLKPEYAQAATILKNKNIKVKLGAMDAPANPATPNVFNVQGYPTLKWFEPGSTGPSSAQEFGGGRTATEIVDWILEQVEKTMPPPEAVQVTKEDVFKKQCVDNTLCVVAVLPHIFDCQSQCRNDYINILNESAKSFRKQGWGWIWSEAGAQPDLEEKLEIGGFGYPALAVLGSKKQKFAILRGSFSKEGVNEFLRDISFGKGQTRDVRGGKLPEIKEVSPWDGKDMPMPDEEDIDLSDIELEDEENGKDEL